jgi:enoyl-CoA hydratase
MFQNLIVEHKNGIAYITINRPNQLNALNKETIAELHDALETAELAKEIGAIILTGSGEKAFVAGADIKEMIDWDGEVARQETPGLQACFNAVGDIPVPTIAAITGYALGGGLELALSCDFRIAASNAVMGQPEIVLGISPGGGGTRRLARLIGPSRAKDLIFTGRRVNADEALTLGLVNEVVDSSDVLKRSMELANLYATGPVTAMKAAKRGIDKGGEQLLADGLVMEQGLFAGQFDTNDQKVGMKSFVENGPGKADFS